MSGRKSLFKIYRVLENTITPGLRYSHGFYEDYLRKYVNTGTRWLDLGCGHEVLPRWRREEEIRLVGLCDQIVGLDADLWSLRRHSSIVHRVCANVNNLPFKDGVFNLVTANMVVEHFDDPGRALKEVSRVLRPGGIFMFHTPNAYGYGTILGRLVPEWLKGGMIRLLQGRREQDVFRTFYRINSPKRISLIGSEVGFEVLEIRMLTSTANFVNIPPLAALELLWIRLLRTDSFKRFRQNMLVVLRKC